MTDSLDIIIERSVDNYILSESPTLMI